MTEEILSYNEGVAELRQAALGKANSELRSKIDWIVDWQHHEASRGILGRWELGQEIDEVWTDLESNQGRRYGKASKSTIALFMREDPSIVNMAHKLYVTYPEKKRLLEICEMTMQDQITRLSYSHIRQLLAIKSDKKRAELLNQCLLNCWTSAELGIEVQKANGGTNTNNPNGRSAVPKDAQTVIGQMLDFADDFTSRNTKVWRDSRHSLTAQVDKLEPIQYTEDLAKKLGELAHRMEQLADEAKVRASEARRNFEHVTGVLKKGPAGIKTAVELAAEINATPDETQVQARPVGRRAKAVVA